IPQSNFRRLPFDHCSLSLQPFEYPVCTEEGVVFDLLSIVPWIKKYSTNPTSGEEKKLEAKSLIKLNFAKNNDGKYHCPVLYSVFTNNSHIVANKVTGNVFSHEAVEQLNIKTKSFKDLLTDEPFTRKDIITLQDPTNLDKFNVSNFFHVKNNMKVLDPDEEKAKQDPAYHLKSTNLETRETLAELYKDYKGDQLLASTMKEPEAKKTDKLNADSFFSLTASLTSGVHHRVRGSCRHDRHQRPYSVPQLRTRLAPSSTMEAENMVHSDSMSPASLGICEKLFRRWELKTSLTEGSARRSQQTLTIRLGLPGTNNSKRPIPNPKAQGSDPLVHRSELQHMAAELGSYKQAHTSSPPLTLGNSRVVEGPAPLKELGSRAQAMRGGIGSSEAPRHDCYPNHIAPAPHGPSCGCAPLMHRHVSFFTPELFLGCSPSRAHYSTGRVSASFTSTAMTPATTHEAGNYYFYVTDAIADDTVRYQYVKKKGYVRLHTNKGDLNLELHCDKVPKAGENFIRLCKKGYYDGTVFHRSIRNFMIQGGDPTGTGTGDVVLFSRSFITFRSCTYLDRKHTVFGRIVGGFETLTAMENVESDPKTDKPKSEIKIISATVFVDPYEEADAQIAAEREKELQKQEEERQQTSIALKKAKEEQAPKTFKAGVGKYINPATVKRPAAEDESGPSTSGAAAKKSKGKTGFGDFSSW
ncbi:hypothetical protein L3Q82_023007, partial [Scortum barcoo]